MSKEQLVTAYLQGEMGQRQLVKRLVAIGVSVTAALAYAAALPTPAHAETTGTTASTGCTVTVPGAIYVRLPDAALDHVAFCGA